MAKRRRRGQAGSDEEEELQELPEEFQEDIEDLEDEDAGEGSDDDEASKKKKKRKGAAALIDDVAEEDDEEVSIEMHSKLSACSAQGLLWAAVNGLNVRHACCGPVCRMMRKVTSLIREGATSSLMMRSMWMKMTRRMSQRQVYETLSARESCVRTVQPIPTCSLKHWVHDVKRMSK